MMVWEAARCAWTTVDATADTELYFWNKLTDETASERPRDMFTLEEVEAAKFESEQVMIIIMRLCCKSLC
jgi:hypothetical protein